MKSFEYVEPRSLEEALGILHQGPGEARILAGGTDLLAKMRRGILTPPLVVNLKAVPGLNGVRAEAEGMRVGALTGLQTFRASPLIGERFPVLARAAGAIASRQIRNMGTVGGNLCLDSRCRFYDHSRAWWESFPKCRKRGGDVCHVRSGAPCEAIVSGDLAAPLLALQAELGVASVRGERTISLEEFFTGGKVPHRLKEDEILTEVRIPDPPPGTRLSWLKHAKRAAIDFPQVSLAAALTCSSSGICTSARVVLGQVWAAPVRATAVESFLSGKPLDPEVLGEASRLAPREKMRFSDADGLAAYKQDILSSLIHRALREASSGKGEGRA